MISKQKLTKTQSILIGGLILFLSLLLLVIGAIAWPDISSIIFPPTKQPIMALATNTEEYFLYATLSAQPTIIETPQLPPTMRPKKPTWTPYPSPTPWPSPRPIPTFTIGPSPSPGQAQPPNYKPDCSAQYAYIAAVHQSNLNYINSYYNQYIAYYQSLLDQAIRERDALEAQTLVQQIKKLKAQRDSAIDSENSRYAAEVAYYDALCK